MPAVRVAVSASGEGSLTVSAYSGNPAPSALSSSTGTYFDVEVASGSEFTSLTVKVCDVGTGNGLDWYNGTSWLAFSDASLGSTGCISATVSTSTSPALAQLTGTFVAVVKTASASGYLVATGAGGVGYFGAVPAAGSMAGEHLNAPIVGVAETPTAKGYWLAAADGGVFTFGTAGFYGSEAAEHLNAPIVGIAAAPTGKGYWLAAADGGVFTFGTAGFHGSESGEHLNAPIVGVAAAPTGKGYWLVAADGGVFTFGTASFQGSDVGKATSAVVGASGT